MAWKKIILEGDAAELSDVAPLNVLKQTADAGTGTKASREDHKHDVEVAVPGDITEGHTAAEGTSTSLARADHEHGSPADWTPKTHATSHKSGGADVINLDELGLPTAKVDVNQQELDGAVLESAASAPDSGTEVAGQIYWNTTEKHPYVWVPA